MGYMRSHTIVVTGHYSDHIDNAHKRAVELFGRKRVSPILGEFTNGSKSFFIAPDGSKEGWAESNKNDQNRKVFKKWLFQARHDDLSSPLDWVEVQYGDDDRRTLIISHSDEEIME